MNRKPTAARLTDDQLLDCLQCEAWTYFAHEWNPDNGLIPDSTRPDSPCSIAAVGLALSCYPIAVERGWLRRTQARERTLAALRFFQNAPQNSARDASGYRGFFYHFLDMKSGRRAWKCELSSIDTALLLAGFLVVGKYFDADTSAEREVRARAQELAAAVDWNWMRNGTQTVAMGWKPPRGFLSSSWSGYNEGLLLMLLGLGAPQHALPAKTYDAWCSTYQWRKLYGHEFLYAGPLFIHQLPHCWIDFRGQRDSFMRAHDCDYWENSRRATHIQREYARRNPRDFAGYAADCWGISACGGPGPCVRQVNGRKRRFWDYRARGVPFGADDGTLSPWATAASLPFAPEIVLPALHHFNNLQLRAKDTYGFKPSFNETFPEPNSAAKDVAPCWVSPAHLALNQGPVVLMIENFRSGLIWDLMRDCDVLKTGLQRAGFKKT